jgi:hypothetical protein
LDVGFNTSIAMRLWTWQKKGFSLSDKSTKVESLENSHFLNDSGIGEGERKHFRNVYDKLFEKLGTCQFHWYFIEEDEAKNEASHCEFFKQNRVLWEVDAPDGKLFKKICSIAWNCLLGRQVFPPKAVELLERQGYQ